MDAPIEYAPHNREYAPEYAPKAHMEQYVVFHCSNIDSLKTTIMNEVWIDDEENDIDILFCGKTDKTFVFHDGKTSITIRQDNLDYGWNNTGYGDPNTVVNQDNNLPRYYPNGDPTRGTEGPKREPGT